MNVEALEHRRFRPKQNGHYDLAYTPPPPVPAYFDVARRKLTRGLARRSNIFHVPVNKTPATVDFAFFFPDPKIAGNFASFLPPLLSVLPSTPIMSLG